jgi:hypothetical protein
MPEPNLAGRAETAASDPAPQTPSGPARPAPSRNLRPVAALLRAHWQISLLLAAGLTLRALTQAAYHPALIYIDTPKYLYGEYPGSDPLGYRVVLKVILAVGDLGTVAVIQHLLGLAMAVVLYVVLLRRGARRWLAALAAAPVLLDAYQLQLEHLIMPDVWFEAMIVAGLALLLWRPAATLPFAVAAGLILGGSATVRQTGEVLILPAVLYLLAAGGGWRRAIGRAAALSVAFALPIVCYCAVSGARTGHFALSNGQPSSGRMAAAADCATLKLPAAVAPLCPTPAQQARGPDWLEHSGQSPLHDAVIPPGTSRVRLISELTSAVERQQPLRVLAAVARDSVRLFAVVRAPSPSVTPISRWQFQTVYPTHPPAVTLGPGNTIVIGLQRRTFGPFIDSELSPAYGGRAQVDQPVARVLRDYQLAGGYTPGPLLALFALAALAGSLLALTRRATSAASRQLALACLLFTGTAVAVLLVPDLLEFSWRYQLPAVVALAPAGALGIAAAASCWPARRRPPGPRRRAAGAS